MIQSVGNTKMPFDIYDVIRYQQNKYKFIWISTVLRLIFYDCNQSVQNDVHHNLDCHLNQNVNIEAENQLLFLKKRKTNSLLSIKENQLLNRPKMRKSFVHKDFLLLSRYVKSLLLYYDSQNSLSKGRGNFGIMVLLLFTLFFIFLHPN